MTDEPQESKVLTQEEQIQAQLAEAEPALERLRADNEQEVFAIAQLGGMVGPEAFNRIRLDMFIEFVFQRLGNVPPDVQRLLAVMFETEFETKMGETLREVKGEVRKAQLGAGSGLTESDLKAMWAQQNGGKKNGNGGGKLFRG